MKRPTSVSIIAWFLIATALISVVTTYTSLDNPVAQELMAKNLLPLSVQYVMLYVGLAISVASGVAMLKGWVWGRTLYIAWSVLGLVIGLATSPLKLMLIPGALILAIIAFFLYRPKAKAFFSQQQAAINA
jgi:type IV secretory pathway TrbL component